MFSEVLKIIPKIDQTALNGMFNNLNRRFMNVAKTFGKGLKAIGIGGAIMGAATTIIDKILNPLKETNDAIDRILKKADDVSDQAQQFNTTFGNMFKLRTLAEATGLDPDALAQMLTKFQTATAEAKADPNKNTSVRAYANETDTAASFFKFIQNLKNMAPDERVLVQQEVFGEKAILKMGDFLNADFAALMQRLKLRDAAFYDQAGKNLVKFQQTEQEDAAARGARDLAVKGGLINAPMIQTRKEMADAALVKENERLKGYQTAALLDQTVTRLSTEIEKSIMFLSNEGLPKLLSWGDTFAKRLDKGLYDVADAVLKLTNSRFFKYFTGEK